MTIKTGVDIRGIAAETVLGMNVVDEVYKRYGLNLVITSVKDGTHMEGSLHYRGRAFDCRMPARLTAIPMNWSAVVKDLKYALGEQWDVVLETNHVHCEFDPKE